MRVLATVILLSIGISLAAQPPIGGGGSRPQGGPGRGRPPMQSMNQQNDNFIITNIPDIPNLTLDQREKLSKEISNEKRDISKLMAERMKQDREAQNPGLASKDRVKMIEKVEKIDAKISKQEEKYDKKYRKILSDDQYLFFKEKKNEIRFNDQRGQGRKKPRPDVQNPQSMPFGPQERREPMGTTGEDIF